MQIDQQQISSVLARCLTGSRLPQEVSLRNENVLNLIEYKKHHSVIFVDRLLFRVIPGKDDHLLEFQHDYEPFFPELQEPSDEWVKIRVQSIDEVVALKESIVNIIEYELRRTHGEAFGCCARYIECSDSKKCIHEDFVFSLGCQYRLNLLENRIFYGKNANS
jgi:hypothetical protein